MMTWLSLAQGAYFLITGIWPLISIGTFQMVTGPKTDLWLVKTVGVIISVIGASLIVFALTNRMFPELLVLGAGSAAGLGLIDVYYSLRGTISKIYLLDAAVEAVIVLAWLIGFFLGR